MNNKDYAASMAELEREIDELKAQNNAMKLKMANQSRILICMAEVFDHVDKNTHPNYEYDALASACREATTESTFSLLAKIKHNAIMSASAELTEFPHLCKDTLIAVEQCAADLLTQEKDI